MTNKDYNYIAAVEKAITEKYGKGTVQDFRSDWPEQKETEYLRQLKKRNKRRLTFALKTLPEIKGDVLVKNPAKERSADRTCPVCKTYSFSSRDDLYMNRFHACYACYIEFVDQREDRWQEGWRPDDERMELALRRRKKCQQY